MYISHIYKKKNYRLLILGALSGLLQRGKGPILKAQNTKLLHFLIGPKHGKGKIELFNFTVFYQLARMNKSTGQRGRLPFQFLFNKRVRTD